MGYIILGDKNRLAIEVSGVKSDSDLMGYARLWLDGVVLGDFSEYIYLDGYLLGGLHQMLNIGWITDEGLPTDIDQQFQYFEKKSTEGDDVGIDSYRVSFGTMTDSFDMWSYRKDNAITLIWRLREGRSVRDLDSSMVIYREYKIFCVNGLSSCI
ncbi:MAG: hypothetical protein NVV59_09040 [Chitinophagaceae bacterium]|nr:hypothetical protein [Chitinophagaceae bacterium]